jgi:hypothetical protein
MSNVLSILASGDPARHRLLSAPHGRNVWCGPAALSAVTGCSTDLAALLVARDRYATDCARRIRGVRGTYTAEICRALNRLGWNAVPNTFPSHDRESLASWLRRFRGDRRARIVSAANHWVAAQDGYVADSRGGLVRADASALRRALVVDVITAERSLLVDFAALERSILDEARAARASRPAARARTEWAVVLVNAAGAVHARADHRSKRAALEWLRTAHIPGGAMEDRDGVRVLVETRWVGGAVLRVAETGEETLVATRGDTEAWETR